MYCVESYYLDKSHIMDRKEKSMDMYKFELKQFIDRCRDETTLELMYYISRRHMEDLRPMTDEEQESRNKFYDPEND